MTSSSKVLWGRYGESPSSLCRRSSLSFTASEFFTKGSEMFLADSIMPVVVKREMVASESLRLPLLPEVATVEGLPQRDVERLEGALAPCAAGVRGDKGAHDAVVALKRLKG